MIKLVRYLKDYIAYIALIFALLFLQAYCDLELPSYTSKIVTQGIQQKGVEDGVPEKMSRETADNLELFLSEEELQFVEESYSEEDDVLVLNDSVMGEQRTLLGETLQVPELLIYMLTSDLSSMTSDESSGSTFGSMISGSSEFSELLSKLPEGVSPLSMISLLPESTRMEIAEKVKEQLSSMPESISGQSAILFVQNEYEALGEDLGSRQTNYLLKVGAVMVLLAFIAMLATVSVTFLTSRMAAGVAQKLRSDIYRKVMSFNSEEFNHFSTASLITRSTNDIQQVQMMLAMAFRMVLYAPILGIGGVLKVMSTDSSMTWIIALAVALLLGLIILLFAIAMPKFTALQTLIDKLNLVSRENLTGVMVTRAFSAEKHEEERFDTANKDLTSTNLFVNRCMTFMMPCMMIIMNGVSVLIVYSGAHGVDQGTIQVGDMMAFIQYAMQIIMSFLMLSLMSIILPRANVSAKRIAEVLETQVVISDPVQPQKPDPAMAGTVEFDHVSFAYPDAQEKVLEDISFKAAKGQTVAFIGSTGSGKSTLIKLIPRFFDVSEGSVKVDGVDVRQMDKQTLCSLLGFVPQKSTLFSGTIDSNIRFGRTDASEEEVIRAAEIAQATEFIEGKEEKYQSPIAQGGSNVSGGQKQRLSIARAIARKPEILIFDDSFSALDFKTDAALRKALKEATSDTTTLIVAQRISTIMHADQIVVLDEGKMAGIGTHKELMQNCEVYRQIATSQLSEEELAV